jgi:hypothetical protein
VDVANTRTSRYDSPQRVPGLHIPLGLQRQAHTDVTAGRLCERGERLGPGTNVALPAVSVVAII